MLAPLADLVPELPVPSSGRTVGELLAALPTGADDAVEAVPWPGG